MGKFKLEENETLIHKAKLRKINIGHHDVVVYFTDKRIVIAGMVFKRVMKEIPYTEIEKVQESSFPLIKRKNDQSIDIIEKNGKRTTFYNYIYGESIPYIMTIIQQNLK